jgi:hypothetical protein
MLKILVTIVAIRNNGNSPGNGGRRPSQTKKPPGGGVSDELRDRDSNPNFRNQNPASYH